MHALQAASRGSVTWGSVSAYVDMAPRRVRTILLSSLSHTIMWQEQCTSVHQQGSVDKCCMTHMYSC